MAAVVLKASAKEVTAVRANGEALHIVGDGLRPVQSGLADKAPRNIMIRRGSVVRLAKTPKDAWGMTQLPEVEGAFVAMDPRDGAIKAMVGGFEFNRSKFNHVTQAWRQPGSSFKPFIYSAALEKGFTPATVVNDAPLYFDAATTGGQPWAPKNYGGTFSGPVALRTALMKSINMVTLRVAQSIGIRYAQDWITNFGFDREKHPAYLPMAIGAGAVTPMQMATAYSVFANGGYRVNPYLITRITDHKDKVLVAPQPPLLNETMRAIPQRNAFIMDTLLQSVVKAGTGAKAYQAFKRDDLYGKTGTTNDSFDTWFAGFQPTMAAIAWMGYDAPRSLGDKETGSSLSSADLDQLHGDRDPGRARDRAAGARRCGPCRRRVVLRRFRAGQWARQPMGNIRTGARRGGLASEARAAVGRAQPDHGLVPQLGTVPPVCGRMQHRRVLHGAPVTGGQSIGAPSVLDVSLFLATVLLGFALVLPAGSVALLIRGAAVDLLRTRVLLGSLVGVAALLALLRLVGGQGQPRNGQERSRDHKAGSPATKYISCIDHLRSPFRWPATAISCMDGLSARHRRAC